MPSARKHKQNNETKTQPNYNHMSLLSKLEAATAAASQLENLAGLSTAMPLLPKGDYPVILTLEVADKKDDPTKKNLLVLARTIYEQEGLADDQSVPINAGYTMRKYFPLQPGNQKDKDAWIKDIKRFLEQVTPDADFSQPFMSLLAATHGLMVYASVVTEPGKGAFGPSNRIVKFRAAEPTIAAQWDADLPEGLRPAEADEDESENEDEDSSEA